MSKDVKFDIGTSTGDIYNESFIYIVPKTGFYTISRNGVVYPCLEKDVHLFNESNGKCEICGVSYDKINR